MALASAGSSARGAPSKLCLKLPTALPDFTGHAEMSNHRDFCSQAETAFRSTIGHQAPAEHDLPITSFGPSVPRSYTSKSCQVTLTQD